MDNHDFYLVKVKDEKILESMQTYTNLLQQNKNDDICVLDKVSISDDFLNVLENFLIFLPNNTPCNINKNSFGLNFYGITVLKNSEILYNIYYSLYNIFNTFEDEFYMLYINNTIKLINKKTYNNIENREFCEKIYKNDILNIFLKLKNFSLKLKEKSYYIIHLGI